MNHPWITTSEVYAQQQKISNSKVLPTSIDHSFPGEIGRFLFKTLVHSTSTLDACRALTYVYEDEDVYEVAHALNDSILANKPSVVLNRSAEISTILNNIWGDKGIQRKIIGTKVGFTASFAAIGAIVKGLTGAGIGLLASFGFDVADRLFGFKDEAISERIGKFFSSNYQAIIYDFKKKYPATASTKKL